MRDKQFVAIHRGGQLTKSNHHQLMKWARECAEHSLSLIEQHSDKRLVHALQIAKEWEKDHVPTGAAMKASLEAHTVAGASSNQILKAVARSVGQAVATAHMADHSIGAALYALKAAKHAGKSMDEERAWQNEQLQSCFAGGAPEIVALVLDTMREKAKGLLGHDLPN